MNCFSFMDLIALFYISLPQKKRTIQWVCDDYEFSVHKRKEGNLPFSKTSDYKWFYVKAKVMILQVSHTHLDFCLIHCLVHLSSKEKKKCCLSELFRYLYYVCYIYIQYIPLKYIKKLHFKIMCDTRHFKGNFKTWVRKIANFCCCCFFLDININDILYKEILSTFWCLLNSIWNTLSSGVFCMYVIPRPRADPDHWVQGGAHQQ